MGVGFNIFYHERVVARDIPAIPKEWRNKIKEAIETKLTMYPEVFGKPLRRSLRDYRKLRVGDYRVIFRIESRIVKIFVIGHRKGVYLVADKRIS